MANGEDIHACNEYALRWSVRKGHLEVAKFLIEKGVDIHANGECALKWNARTGNWKAVKFLLDNGADAHTIKIETLTDLTIVEIANYIST